MDSFKLLLSSMMQLVFALFFVSEACLFINVVFLVEFAESVVSKSIFVGLFLLFLNDLLVRFLLYLQNHVSIMFMEPLPQNATELSNTWLKSFF